MIRYFKITGIKLQHPMYYAAYTEEAAKREVHSDFNSQIAFSISELENCPHSEVIHCCSDLSYKDAKQVTGRLSK